MESSCEMERNEQPYQMEAPEEIYHIQEFGDIEQPD